MIQKGAKIIFEKKLPCFQKNMILNGFSYFFAVWIKIIKLKRNRKIEQKKKIKISKNTKNISKKKMILNGFSYFFAVWNKKTNKIIIKKNREIEQTNQNNKIF